MQQFESQEPLTRDLTFDAPVEREIATLQEALRAADRKQRMRAAQALGDRGPPAVEPLCAALEDREIAVQIAAAQSLGQIGDERAVRPLAEALRGCFIGRSGGVHLVASAAAFAAELALYLAVIAGAMALGIPGALAGILGIAVRLALLYYAALRSREDLRRAIADALGRIAGQDPTPELRMVLADLRAVAADALRQGKATRAASREAAARIEALTEELKSLPTPAPAPRPDPTPLPRPAPGPNPGWETPSP